MEFPLLVGPQKYRVMLRAVINEEAKAKPDCYLLAYDCELFVVQKARPPPSSRTPVASPFTRTSNPIPASFAGAAG